jgi:hypothetical protein
MKWDLCAKLVLSHARTVKLAKPTAGDDPTAAADTVGLQPTFWSSALFTPGVDISPVWYDPPVGTSSEEAP